MRFALVLAGGCAAFRLRFALVLQAVPAAACASRSFEAHPSRNGRSDAYDDANSTFDNGFFAQAVPAATCASRSFKAHPSRNGRSDAYGDANSTFVGENPV